MNSPAIPVLHQHHVSISVPDIEQAISWYGEILGFTVHSRFDIQAISAQGAFLKRDTYWIELWQVGTGSQVPNLRKNPDTDLLSGGTKHMAFRVPDLQSHLRELVNRGVDIAAVQRDPTEPMQGEIDPAAANQRPAFAAFIRDPAGTLIELLDHAALVKMNMV